MKLRNGIIALALVVACTTASASAQIEATPAGDAAIKKDPYANFKTQTFYLTNTSQQSEATEILTAIRNMLRATDKVYFVPTQNAIIVSASPEDLLLTQKLISDLDRPRKSYRLTYTLNESESGKRIGSQHFAMIVVSGQKTMMKQSSRVPIATGSQNQYNYLDISLDFEATLDESVNGVRLRTKTEQSSIADEKSDVQQIPIVRNATLEGTSILTPGKPLILGSIDIPGSTRHHDIEVVMEVVK